MIDYIMDILKENTLAQGGLVIAAFSGCLYYCKKIPSTVMAFLERRCTSYIMLDHQQEQLQWVLNWLSRTKYGQKTRHLTVDQDGKVTIGPGMHFFIKNRRLVIVSYDRSYNEMNGMTFGKKENISLRVIPGDRKTIEQVLKESELLYGERSSHLLEVYSAKWGGFNHKELFPKRHIDSVVLTDDNEHKVQNALEKFTSNKDRCLKLGVPWRLGFLLSGDPGNGKTSLAAAIASQLNYKLYILNLNGIESDQALLDLCSDVGERSLLLIEDIDAYNIARKQDGDKSISLSGVLNVLDGITSRNGRITIITTNDPDQLDDAIVRKGRIDVHLSLNSPNQNQIERLFDRFEQSYQGQEFDNMASVQDFLLHNTQ